MLMFIACEPTVFIVTVLLFVRVLRMTKNSKSQIWIYEKIIPFFSIFSNCFNFLLVVKMQKKCRKNKLKN